MPQTPSKQAIVGAGLVGALLARGLGRRGIAVDVYERRDDSRLNHNEPTLLRSINLALAERGIATLKEFGVYERISDLLIPMAGRMVHDLQGQTNFQPYGIHAEQVIYSITRRALNERLITAAEELGNVRFYFNKSSEDIDFAENRIQFADQSFSPSYDMIYGCDGTGSVVRKSILQKFGSQDVFVTLDHGYKELCIPPKTDGSFALANNALHIWPRGNFMMIALPNADHSFTVTLFMPHEGSESFAALTSADAVDTFFAKYFADAVPLFGNLQQQFFANPIGKMGTVHCEHWNFANKVLLMGDAAHGIVPFHGQGMNCGFEDCLGWDSVLSIGNVSLESVGKFVAERKENCKAIADLALENYEEMRDKVRDAKFKLENELAFELERRHPRHFVRRYSMVMFHRIPYSIAKQRGGVQSKILHKCTQGVEGISEVDWGLASSLVERELEPIF